MKLLKYGCAPTECLELSYEVRKRTALANFPGFMACSSGNTFPYNSLPLAMDFISIDFETATPQRDSPCEIGVTVVQGRQLVVNLSL